MSVFSLWEEAAPHLDGAKEMVLLAEVQSLLGTGRGAADWPEPPPGDGPERGAVLPANAKQLRHEAAMSDADKERDRLEQFERDISLLLARLRSCNSDLVSSSTEIHSLPILFSTRFGGEHSSEERLKEVRSTIRSYETLAAAAKHLEHADRLGDAVQLEKHLSDLRSAIAVLIRAETTDCNERIRQGIQCIQKIIPLLEDKIERSCSEEEFYTYCRLYSLAAHGLEETLYSNRNGASNPREKILKLLYERCKELSQAEQLELVRKALPHHRFVEKVDNSSTSQPQQDSAPDTFRVQGSCINGASELQTNGL